MSPATRAILTLAIATATTLAMFFGPAKAPLIGIPPWAIAFAVVGALMTYAVASGRGLRSFVAHFPWGIFPFVSALLVMVRAITKLGVDVAASEWFTHAVTSAAARITTTATGTAVVSNLVNNLPAVMFAQVILERGTPDAPAAYGALLGADLGPNLVPFGSLATMLVISSAQSRGIEVRRRDVFFAGLESTPVVLAAAVLALIVTFAIHP